MSFKRYIYVDAASCLLYNVALTSIKLHDGYIVYHKYMENDVNAMLYKRHVPAAFALVLP